MRRIGRLAIALVLLTPLGALADQGVVRLLPTGFRIEDNNGDLDGFADTNEAVTMHFRLSNGQSIDFENVVVRISTSDPKVECYTQTIPVGHVAAQADSQPLSFRFKVHALADRGGLTATCDSNVCSNFAGGCVSPVQCRRTTNQDYSATFVLDVQYSPLDGALNSILQPQPTYPLRVDLDLNASNGALTTATFAQSFETGIGNFALMNMDANLASNSLSDGKRCQYNDPDYPESNSYGQSECYLGFASPASLNDWHQHTAASPDGGRAFAGSNSLHYGVHTSAADSNDYGYAQMDGIRTGTINLAARVCANDPASDKRACAADSDCVVAGGGPCVAAAPELSFKQQVAFLNWFTRGPRYTAPDRAIVMVQIQGALSWQKLVPSYNTYDVQAAQNFSNCTFDPDDDGNNEDSYFEPTDPDRRFGPSSACWPEMAFSQAGATEGAFNPANIGLASHGPGLPGSIGPGTWVETRFDLSPYRGRRILLRWLVTTVRVGQLETTSELFMNGARDDGWWMDDVRVSQTLGASSGTVVVDNAANAPGSCDLDGDGVAPLDNCPDTPNVGQADADLDGIGDACDLCPAVADPDQTDSDRDRMGDACDECPNDSINFDSDGDGACDLEDNCESLSNPDQQDSDGDEFGDACDCAPADPTAFALEEIGLLLWFSKTEFSWSQFGGSGTLYDVVRGSTNELPVGAGPSETCLGTNPQRIWNDPQQPPAGVARWYLVRMRNACGLGSYGTDSEGEQRVPSVPCP